MRSLLIVVDIRSEALLFDTLLYIYQPETLSTFFSNLFPQQMISSNRIPTPMNVFVCLGIPYKSYR